MSLPRYFGGLCAVRQADHTATSRADYVSRRAARDGARLMGRPADWWVLDLDGDPTPGDPFRVRELARKFSELSADAFEAAADVRRQAGEGGVTGWVGEAGAVFGGAIGELPGQLDKLDTSYGMVGRALTAYAGELETAQTQADAALVRGREARRRLDIAQGQVAGVETEEESARSGLSVASGVWPLTAVPASWSTEPPPGVDPEQVRTHADASTRLSGLRTQAADAQADVDAERALAVAARTLRETAASTCKGEIDRASDAGIQNRSFWDRARDFVSDAWDVLVKLAEVVIVVAAIAALVLGGPVLWTLVVVAAAVVLADKLMAYANGEASLWDVGFALLNFVPGGKALTLGAGLARGASRLRSLGGLVRGGWGTARNMAGGVRNGARRMAARFFGGDPVDVVTGQVTLTQTDVELPGLLPLVLERAHHSTYRHGRHFGGTWASTLDQRLEVDAEGACLTVADGTILTYPTPPAAGEPVLPAEGVRWLLAVHPNTGGYTVTDPQTGRVMLFPPSAPDVDLEAGQVAVLPLAAVVDRNDHRIDVDRDAEGVPVTVRHTGGYEIAVDTTDSGQVQALRLVSGDGEPLSLVRFGYDPDGRLAEVVNSSGLPLRFGYDDHDRLTDWTDRNGHWYSYVYDEAGRCVRGAGSGGYLSNTFAYRPESRTTVVTDSLGHQRVYVHNELGQVVRETDPLGNSTTMVWSRYDWLVQWTDPIDRTWSYDYDQVGNPVTVARPDGGTASVSYDERSRPLLQTEPDGACWERTYDERGNLLSTTDPLGAVSSYAYGSDRPGHLTALVDALGHTTHVESSGAGLPTEVVTATGATTRVAYGADGRAATVIDPLGGVSTYAWTVEGKLLSRTGPDGGVERWAYDGEGNLVEHVDPAGNTTRHEYTHFDLPSARIGPDGTRLAFGYDTELRLTSVTNPQGLHWTYAYDPAGRLRAETDFDGRRLQYDYDSAGQLVARTNRVEQTVEFVRNLLGEVTEKRMLTGVTTFAFDRAGRQVRATNSDADCRFTFDGLGRIVSETVNTHTVASTYDLVGRRIRRTTPSGAESKWEWTPDGLPSALHTAGRVLTFDHDLTGRETSRTLDSGVTVAQIWDVAHRLLGQTVTADRPSSTVEASENQQSRLVSRRSYGYSPDGCLIHVDDLLSGSRGYRLDPVRRVTAVSGNDWRETYAYDESGNIADAAWSVPGPRDDAEARYGDAQGTREYVGTLVRRSGRFRYEHDAQGRVTIRRQKRLSGPPRVWRYTWDSDDRLVGVITPEGQRWRYLYDPYGRRIGKQREEFDGNVVERIDFVWDGIRLVEQVRTVGAGVEQVTTWDWQPDSFRPIAQTERGPNRLPRVHKPGAGQDAESSTSQDQQWFDVRFYLIVTDLVGSPAELVHTDGDIAWLHRTTLWGVPATGQRDTVDCPLRFPGQYHDQETGANYNYHRHYDPSLGRYESGDPVGLAGGTRPYNYVLNPTEWIDPLGLAPYSVREGYTSSPALRGDPYHPDEVQARSAQWHSHFADRQGAAAARVVERGRGPREVVRVDGPEQSVPGSQWHAHGRNGGALNQNGTIHDRDPQFVSKTLDWLRSYGWDV